MQIVLLILAYIATILIYRQECFKFHMWDLHSSHFFLLKNISTIAILNYYCYNYLKGDKYEKI